MTYSDFELDLFTEGTIDGVPVTHGLAMRINYINAGKTPATRTIIIFTHSVEPLTQDEFPTHFSVLSSEEGSTGSVGPGRFVSGPGRAVGPQETDDIMARRSRLWLYSRGEYGDPGDKKESYLTEVCMKMMYLGDRVAPDGTRRPHFVGEIVGPQNTIR